VLAIIGTVVSAITLWRSTHKRSETVAALPETDAS
jgi:hypothetical protein